jgi:hypothetical protein
MSARPFTECEIDIVRVDDALRLVTACIEQDTGRVLIEAARLPDEFFDLRTRFAGEFIQKLQNYRVRLAIVLPPDVDRPGRHGERFAEFVREARGGSGFRFFDDRGGAEAWLAQ